MGQEFCIYCGQKLEPGMKFCDQCGRSVAEVPLQNHDMPKNISAEQDSNIKGEELVNPTRNAPPPPSKNHGCMMKIVIAIVAFLLVLIGGKFLYNNLPQGLDDVAVQVGKMITKATNSLDSSNSKVNGAYQGVTTMDNSITYTAYLPAPNKKWFYQFDTLKMECISAKISSRASISTVSLFSQSEAQGEHFFIDNQGIYFAFDDNLQNRQKLLPAKLETGAIWTNGALQCKILSLDEDVNLDFKTFSHCLCIEERSTADGTVTWDYVALGIGTVLAKNQQSGKIVFKLVKIEDVPEQEAISIVKKYSPTILQ